MRILVISNMYPKNYDEVNGIFVHEQIKKLIKNNCEVKVICPIPWSPFPVKYFKELWRKYSKVPKKQNWEKVEVYYPRYIGLPNSFFFEMRGEFIYQSIKKLIKEIKKKWDFDLIHSHMAFPDGYVGGKLSEDFSVPYIVTIHGMDFQQYIYESKKLQIIEKEVINKSAKTICVSNKLKNIGINKLGIEKDKFEVINNGVDVNITCADIPEDMKSQYKKNKVILSVGNIIETKGHDLLIKAFNNLKEKYKDLIVIIIGNGKNENEIKSLVNKYKLNNRVFLKSRMPHKNVMKYMALCDIFALPSWEEGFGVVYLEAMAHGKPCIGVKGQGIEDVIDSGENGLLIEGKSVKSLEEKLIYLLENKSKANEIGKKAKKTILQGYTWNINAKKNISIYEEILNK